MFEFDLIQCGLIVLLLMVAGEVISHKFKAVVPSILASSVLLLILIWTNILPANVIQASGLTHLTSLAIMFVILGMGISTNPRELMENWRVVTLAALCYVAQTAIVLIVISTLFDRNTAIGGLPGGSAVALIIQERARALGHDHIVVQSVLLLAVQGLAACPLVSWMLRKEVKKCQNEGICAEAETSLQPDQSPAKPRKEQSPYWSLLRFYAAAWVAGRLELATGISRYVFCLLLGVVLAKAGFFSRDEMERSKSHGFLSVMMMTMCLDGFSGATPEMFLSLLKPLCCILLVDVVSIFLLSQIIGKFLGFSRPMRFAICLNVMVGFPLNLMLAQDIIDFLVDSPEEKEVLNRRIGTKMVIAGFTSVTFLSTVGAGLLVPFMK